MLESMQIRLQHTPPRTIVILIYKKSHNNVQDTKYIRIKSLNNLLTMVMND